MNIKYIAGFFDGEGSIMVMKRKIRTTLPQTNKEILLAIKDYFGVGGVCPIQKRKAHWKDAWTYYSGSNKASYKILNELKDHLILKKDKAINALAILNEYIKIKDERNSIKAEAVKLVQEGLSYREVQKITGVSRTTICNEIKKVRGAA